MSSNQRFCIVRLKQISINTTWNTYCFEYEFKCCYKRINFLLIQNIATLASHIYFFFQIFVSFSLPCFNDIVLVSAFVFDQPHPNKLCTFKVICFISKSCINYSQECNNKRLCQKSMEDYTWLVQSRYIVQYSAQIYRVINLCIDVEQFNS